MKKTTINFSKVAVAVSFVMVSGISFAQMGSTQPTPDRASVRSSPTTDTGFIRKHVMANMEEIRLAEIGRDNATNSEVRELAELMISDHNQILTDLNRIGDNMKVPSPDTTLMSLPLGDNTPSEIFDRTWVTQMLAKHRSKVTELEAVESQLKDPELKAIAKSALPKIKFHLATLEKLASKVGAATQ